MGKPSPNPSIEQSFVSFSANQSALVFVLATVGTFIMTGALQYYFYLGVFEDVVLNLSFLFATLIPIIIQSVRFAFLMATSRHFSTGDKGKGFFTLIGSIGVTAFCGYEMQELANTWGALFPEWAGSLFLVFEFLVWGGFVLELGLIIAVAGTAAPSREGAEETDTQQPIPPAADNEILKRLTETVSQLALSVQELRGQPGTAQPPFAGNGATA
ncbi:MAG: hypothetical protein R2830_19405 [Saprospiraceae bacterium]